MGRNAAQRYPSLGRVLLIESRHGVRVQVLEALKSSHLFANIIQPISLSDGMNRICSEAFDACIVGSSVKRHKAEEFVSTATEATKGTETALLALVREAAESLPILPGVHQSLQWPCTPREFTEGVVEGVVTANPETVWAPIFHETRATLQTRPAASVRRDDRAVPAQPTAIITPSTSASLEIDLAQFLGGDIRDLEEIIGAVDRGELNLDESERPDRVAQFALARVTQRMFSGHSRSRKILEFKEYFSASLELWFVDLVNYGAPLANTNLRNSLLAFTQQ